MCQRKEKIKNLKVVERVCAGQFCVLNWRSLNDAQSLLFIATPPQGRVKTLPGLGLLLLIKHQLDQSYFHYNCEPSPLLSRIHFRVINLAETPHCTKIRLVM